MFCGIDWAEDHHDVALVDTDGTLIIKRRISDDAAGYALLLQLLADAGDDPEDPIPVAIETSRASRAAKTPTGRGTARTGAGRKSTSKPAQTSRSAPGRRVRRAVRPLVVVDPRA